MQHVGNWAELLEPIINDVFTQRPREEKYPDHVSELFGVRKTDKMIERSLGRGGIGLMQPWEQTGAQVHYDEIAKGYEVIWRMGKFSNGLPVDRRLWDYDQLDEIKDQVKDLSDSSYNTRQTHGAGIFNYAFSAADSAGASTLGVDGKPLCAASHALIPNGSVTFTNAGALALTALNLTTTRNAMKAWTDDRGNKLLVRPDTLLVPSSKWQDALTIVNSDKLPDTSDNNVNVWKGQLKVIEWDLLDDGQWFLMDSRRAKRFLIWYDARIPKIEQDGWNFDTEVAKFKVVGEWAIGWKTPTFIYGHQAA